MWQTQLHILSHVILTLILWNHLYHFPYFTNEENEAQRNDPGLCWVGERDSGPDGPLSRACSLQCHSVPIAASVGP